MTEFEARKELKELVKDDKRISAEEYEALEKAIFALEEIEEYRAIGTVEELNSLKEKTASVKIKRHKVGNETIFYCGACGRDIYNDVDQYCSICGRKIDWH